MEAGRAFDARFFTKTSLPFMAANGRVARQAPTADESPGVDVLPAPKERSEQGDLLLGGRVGVQWKTSRSDNE